MAQCLRLLIVLVCVCGMVAGQDTRPAVPAVKLSDPIVLPFAGVKIALPADMELKRTSDKFDIVRAVKSDGKDEVLAVTLSAEVRPPDVKLDDFMEATLPRNLAIRSLKVAATRPTKAAGLDGQIQVLSYTSNGIESSAARLGVIRPVNEKLALGYVLSVEGDRKHGRDILPVLGAVARSLEMSELVRPVTQKIEQFGEPLTSLKYDFVIRAPLHWKASLRENIVTIFQTDYLQVTMLPSVSFTATPVFASNSEQHGRKLLDRLAENARSRNHGFQILKQGNTKLSDQDAYEYLFRETMPATTDRPEAVMLMGSRVAVVGNMSYVLLFMWGTDSQEDLAAALEALCAGIQITRKATSAPASEPATMKAP